MPDTTKNIPGIAIPNKTEVEEAVKAEVTAKNETGTKSKKPKRKRSKAKKPVAV